MTTMMKLIQIVIQKIQLSKPSEYIFYFHFKFTFTFRKESKKIFLLVFNIQNRPNLLLLSIYLFKLSFIKIDQIFYFSGKCLIIFIEVKSTSIDCRKLLQLAKVVFFRFVCQLKILNLNFNKITDFLFYFWYNLQMNIRFCMFLLLLLIVFCSPYTLTGQWKLTQLNGKSTDKAIILNIFQSVTSPKQIRNILQFSNCHNILYQVKVNDNLMLFDEKKIDQTFFDANTNILLEQNTKECSEDESNLEKRIADTLKKVFFFNIRDDLLVFISTNGMDLFEFERVKKIYENNLLGTWVLDRLFWEKALPTKVLITQDNKAYFCDGKIQTTYTTNKVNIISFEITKNENCPQTNLTKAINHIKYYRLKDTELQLFDEYSVQIAEIWYQSNQVDLKPEQKVVKSSEQLQKLTKEGLVIIVDPINTVQVENQIQPYLRKEDKNTLTTPSIQNKNENVSP